MTYFILFISITLLLGIGFHLKHQLRKTVGIRRDLHEARSNKVLTGLHSLRRND